MYLLKRGQPQPEATDNRETKILGDFMSWYWNILVNVNMDSLYLAIGHLYILITNLSIDV